MALLGEQLVNEWLNRIGFFTLRGIKMGVHEIDLLGIRMREGVLEGWHVEAQISSPRELYWQALQGGAAGARSEKQFVAEETIS